MPEAPHKRGLPPVEAAGYSDAPSQAQGETRLPSEMRYSPGSAGNPDYSTATASISIRNSGWAKAATATSVWAGIFLPKNSSRTGP